jgi:hypothetical protein
LFCETDGWKFLLKLLVEVDALFVKQSLNFIGEFKDDFYFFGHNFPLAVGIEGEHTQITELLCATLVEFCSLVKGIGHIPACF